MSDRRLILMIASQCEQMQDLGFIPGLDWVPGSEVSGDRRLPLDVYEQFVDPDAGACAPVEGLFEVAGDFLPSPDSALLINPNRDAVIRAGREAFRQAVDAPGLVLYFVGHGATAGTEAKHYLMLRDSSASPSDDDAAWMAYGSIASWRKNAPRLAGLLAITDACATAHAKDVVGRDWPVKGAAKPYRWIGASREEPAYAGCFSRALLSLMRDGVGQGAHPSEGLRSELYARDVLPIIDQQCGPGSEYPGQEVATAADDDHRGPLFLSLNRAVQAADAALGLTGETARRFRSITAPDHYYRHGVEEVREAFLTTPRPLFVVVGGAGTGKTRLAGELRSPSDGSPGFDAIAFLERLATPDSIAHELHSQLLLTPEYRSAHEAHRRSNPLGYDEESPFEQILAGPLAHLTGDPVEVILDGLDQLGDRTRDRTIQAFVDLTVQTPDRIRILATSRPEGPIPAGIEPFPMPPLTDPMRLEYLTSIREIPSDAAEKLLAIAGEENWLVLDLLAELYDTGGGPSATLDGMYAAIFDDAKSRSVSPEVVDKAVAILAVAGSIAGVGARTPYGVFQRSIGKLGGPSTPAELYPLLSSDGPLYRIMERTRPATPDEHVGFFHLTAIETMGDLATTSGAEAAGAIADALIELTRGE